MKKFLTISPFLIILFSSTLFVGCFGVDGNFSSLKNKILSSTGNRYYTDVEFSVGSFGISIAKAVVKSDDNDREAKEILDNISHVQIGVYKNHHSSSFNNSFQILKDIDSQMMENGWQYVVRSRCNKEVTGVYVKIVNGNELKELFVVNLDQRELTLVEVKGNLEKVLETAIREKGFKLGHSFAFN